MNDNSQQVVMYILMRNDLASMTPGRAIAQGTHAANHTVYSMKDHGNTSLLQEWEAETTQNFGTTIVLGANIQQIHDIMNNSVMSGFNISKGITHDPEYLVRDGQVSHLIPLDTCGWLFGRKSDIMPFVEHLSLY